MQSIIEPHIATRFIDIIYNKVLTGTGGMDNASALAQKYNTPSSSLHEQVNSLVRRQKLLAGSSGLLTGLGGILSLPIAIPANIASVVFIQLRMIAAIAYLGGYDIEDKKVRSLVIACLAGNAAKEVLQEVGIFVGKRLTRQMVVGISEKSINCINSKIGCAIISKVGTRGAVNLSRIIPIAGGVVSGTIDVITTEIIARMAKKTFLLAG